MPSLPPYPTTHVTLHLIIIDIQGDDRTLVDFFVKWPERNHLNVKKTRGTVREPQREEDTYTVSVLRHNVNVVEE